MEQRNAEFWGFLGFRRRRIRIGFLLFEWTTRVAGRPSSMTTQLIHENEFYYFQILRHVWIYSAQLAQEKNNTCEYIPHSWHRNNPCRTAGTEYFYGNVNLKLRVLVLEKMKIVKYTWLNVYIQNYAHMHGKLRGVWPWIKSSASQLRGVWPWIKSSD